MKLRVFYSIDIIVFMGKVNLFFDIKVSWNIGYDCNVPISSKNKR